MQFQNTLFKDLPQWMLDCLGLRAGEEYLIPKHLHLFRTALIGFGGRKSSEGERDLILHAPPPRHFLETAEALNLRYSQLPASGLYSFGTLQRFALKCSHLTSTVGSTWTNSYPPTRSSPGQLATERGPGNLKNRTTESPNLTERMSRT